MISKPINILISIYLNHKRKIFGYTLQLTLIRFKLLINSEIRYLKILKSAIIHWKRVIGQPLK